jgi:predicted helicase
MARRILINDMQHAQFASYGKEIEAALQQGNATEHTHRTALKLLLESLDTGITATNEPKRIRCGAPDYIVTQGQTPLGYIEAKDVGESLDKVERGEQMRRYRESLANLVLTDYLEFRWYVGGEHRMTARLARVGLDNKVRLEKDGAEQVAALLTAFLTAQVPTIGTPRELAERMAALARLIRDAIGHALADGDEHDPLHQQMEGFRRVLLHDLTAAQFADMYAQTICYGLFAARCNHHGPERFTRLHAAYELPKTNPFLRRMFNHIAGPDLDERIAWAVEDVAELLHYSDMSAILQNFGKRTRQEDPVVHFYETFLAAYDPKMRESRGVYYTPEPVVSYIVRSVDHILKTDFGLPDGLADAGKIKVKHGDAEIERHRVLILDPATGTGTFLYGVINRIYESFKNNRGLWSGYVSQHLLPRLFGFELLMAPYAVAHLKLGLLLGESGYDFASDERLRVYLTNTLEEASRAADSLFAQWVAEEANAAAAVKQELPIMVVLGNPPYSGHSANTGQWISDLLRDRGGAGGSYFEVDGQPLGEKNPKWLNDDYVKFIRFAQWRIERTGYGVLAFITNHGYLDNPTFRGMRRSLMQTFDELYLLDLHGNSKKKEKAPDGGKDENVFDIQQGVAIGIFVKKPRSSTQQPSDSLQTTVHHAHQWGEREKKYNWLRENDVVSTLWTTFAPHSPFYLLVPQDIDLREEYERGWKIADALPINTVGVVTGQDARAIALTLSEAEHLAKLHGLPPSTVRRILYRPFDTRFIVYHKQIVTRPRSEVMQHMTASKNLGIVANRQIMDGPIRHNWVTQSMADLHIIQTAHASAYIFPLYLYPSSTKTNLFEADEPSDAPGSRRPNLAPEFIADVEKRLGLKFVPDGKGDRTTTFGPEDVFDYMYAVFHAPAYRSRYAEFLKIDFPRLPLTSNLALFPALCDLGAQLVGLHLLEQHGPNLTSYPVAGSNLVEAVRYEEPPNASGAGRVWINTAQYFEGVPLEVWNFHVGGYQVCQKWLKDRKGRVLDYDDLTHYRHIVAALAETMRLMAEIDAAIEAHGGWPLS